MAISPRHLGSLMTAAFPAVWAGSVIGDPIVVRKREADEMPVARGAVARRRPPGCGASRRRKLRRRGQR